MDWKEKYDARYPGFNTLVGEVLTEIHGTKVGSEQITFKTLSNKTFRMYHEQDCCEHVKLEEIHGDIQDLINTPILFAEESTNNTDNKPSEYADSWTWTFYRMQTIKGSVQLRWLGESNGYYSEGVTFEKI